MVRLVAGDGCVARCFVPPGWLREFRGRSVSAEHMLRSMDLSNIEV